MGVHEVELGTLRKGMRVTLSNKLDMPAALRGRDKIEQASTK